MTDLEAVHWESELRKYDSKRCCWVITASDLHSSAMARSEYRAFADRLRQRGWKQDTGLNQVTLDRGF